MLVKTKYFLLSILLSYFITPSSYAIDDPWADEVITYFGKNQNIGFTNPQVVLGSPMGYGTSLPAMNGIYSIGSPGEPQESYIIVKFNTPVEDNPQNPMGLDCIIYSNAFWVGGDMKRKFIEPGLIEISKDVNKNGLPDDKWYVISGSRNLSRSIFPQGLTTNTPSFAGNVVTLTSNEAVWGYADTNPTMAPYRDNYVRPDNPFWVGIDRGSGGGDAFDIAWAVDENGNSAGIDEFDFLRVSTIPNILDPVYGYFTTEVMAFADVAPDVDSDGDGVLDEYEIRVAGTDPNRPECTVLPLEIPMEWGGSPAGTELGTACNQTGTLCISLFSSGSRTGTRDYNCNVDLQTVLDPSTGGVSELKKGNLFIQFISSISDFQSAQVALPKVTVQYTAGQIVGLDESILSIYRWDGTEWTNAGINVVDRDLINNKIGFQTRYTGIFGIFSVVGEGDINPGQGHIRLVANTTQTKVAGYGEIVRIIGDEIKDANDMPVVEGTMFTVNSFLLDILNIDDDMGTEGIQVAVRDGELKIELEAGTVAGRDRVTIHSLDNTIRGEVFIEVLPGPPGYVSEVWNLGSDGNYYSFISDEISDVYGNRVQSGVVTVEVAGGIILTQDALPTVEGHQIQILQGRGFFIVKPVSETKTIRLEVCIYDEPHGNVLICREFEVEVKALPIAGKILNVFLMLIIGVFLLMNGRRGQKDIHNVY